MARLSFLEKLRRKANRESYSRLRKFERNDDPILGLESYMKQILLQRRGIDLDGLTDAKRELLLLEVQASKISEKAKEIFEANIRNAKRGVSFEFDMREDGKLKPRFVIWHLMRDRRAIGTHILEIEIPHWDYVPRPAIELPEAV